MDFVIKRVESGCCSSCCVSPLCMHTIPPPITLRWYFNRLDSGALLAHALRIPALPQNMLSLYLPRFASNDGLVRGSRLPRLRSSIYPAWQLSFLFFLFLTFSSFVRSIFNYEIQRVDRMEGARTRLRRIWNKTDIANLVGWWLVTFSVNQSTVRRVRRDGSRGISIVLTESFRFEEWIARESSKSKFHGLETCCFLLLLLSPLPRFSRDNDTGYLKRIPEQLYLIDFLRARPMQ